MPEDYLLKKGEEARDKLEKKRAEVLFEKQQECVFRPEVNPISE